MDNAPNPYKILCVLRSRVIMAWMIHGMDNAPNPYKTLCFLRFLSVMMPWIMISRQTFLLFLFFGGEVVGVRLPRAAAELRP